MSSALSIVGTVVVAIAVTIALKTPALRRLQ